MSYILDALRRADAERELGEVPGLHTQATTLPRLDDGFESPPDRPWRWAALVLGLLATGSVVWFVAAQRAEPPKSAVVLASPTVPTMAGPAVPTPLPPVDSKAVPVPVQVLPPPGPATLVNPPAESSQKKAPTIASASAASAGVPKKAQAVVTSRIDPQKPTKAVAASTPQDAVPTLSDLPEAIRREQPKLTIGGAMHSATPANRMLILNGQVFHEGDQVTADLVLEQIKLKSAVLVYKGYRYSINY